MKENKTTLQEALEAFRQSDDYQALMQELEGMTLEELAAAILLNSRKKLLEEYIFEANRDWAMWKSEMDRTPLEDVVVLEQGEYSGNHAMKHIPDYGFRQVRKIKESEPRGGSIEEMFNEKRILKITFEPLPRELLERVREFKEDEQAAKKRFYEQRGLHHYYDEMDEREKREAKEKVLADFKKRHFERMVKEARESNRAWEERRNGGA